MKESTSLSVRIYMAGDMAVAGDVIQKYYATVGGCVTLTATEYIYTGGRESGFIVGLINYPPYPDAIEDSLVAKALALANILKVALGQQSFTVQGPTRTITIGRDHIA